MNADLKREQQVSMKSGLEGRNNKKFFVCGDVLYESQ